MFLRMFFAKKFGKLQKKRYFCAYVGVVFCVREGASVRLIS